MGDRDKILREQGNLLQVLKGTNQLRQSGWSHRSKDKIRKKRKAERQARKG